MTAKKAAAEAAESEAAESEAAESEAAESEAAEVTYADPPDTTGGREGYRADRNGRGMRGENVPR